VQPPVGLGRLVQRVLLDLDVHRAGPREVEHLHQRTPGAPVRRAHDAPERLVRQRSVVELVECPCAAHGSAQLVDFHGIEVLLRVERADGGQ
jgi:hypothetical protein